MTSSLQLSTMTASLLVSLLWLPFSYRHKPATLPYPIPSQLLFPLLLLRRRQRQRERERQKIERHNNHLRLSLSFLLVSYSFVLLRDGRLPSTRPSFVRQRSHLSFRWWPWVATPVSLTLPLASSALAYPPSSRDVMASWPLASPSTETRWWPFFCFLWHSFKRRAIVFTWLFFFFS